ncbi:MAG: hypothetical protein PHC46_04540 [Clostridia bacterium]|nr:hypothetical protein [Clostridia bacterium]
MRKYKSLINPDFYYTRSDLRLMKKINKLEEKKSSLLIVTERWPDFNPKNTIYVKTDNAILVFKVMDKIDKLYKKAEAKKLPFALKHKKHTNSSFYHLPDTEGGKLGCYSNQNNVEGWNHVKEFYQKRRHQTWKKGGDLIDK